MRNLGIVVLIILIFPAAFAQVDYGRKIVDTLASDAYFGRGYVNNGDKLAANFIAKEFKKNGVLPIKNSYFQEFNLSVNTFPSKVEVTFSNKTLQTGEDFIIDANSGSAKGEYTIQRINQEQVIQMLSRMEDVPFNESNDIAFLLELEAPKDNNERSKQYYIKQYLASLAPVFIEKETFTWTVGDIAYKYPIIEIKKEFVENENTVTLNIENKFIDKYTSQNVIGIIPAKKKKNQEKYIFFTAHYDHLGMMGKTATMNGANDNASGTAMMLSLMKYYSTNKPKYTMVFIGFGGEEAGLIGSKYFTENPLIPLNKIKFLVNVDLMGTGIDGITVVNATEHPKQFKLLQKINKKDQLLKAVNERGKAANSDHYWFEEKGVPSFFMYTLGGVTYYHDIHDRPETLPLTEFNDLNTLIQQFVKKL